MEQTPQTPAAQEMSIGQGLSIDRRFTTPDVHPFDAVEWERRDARIGHGDQVAFEQRDVEFPKSWSQNATNIVAQKYFRGQLESPERERSVKQMIGRVARARSPAGAASAATSPPTRTPTPSRPSSPTSCSTRWRPSIRRCGSTWGGIPTIVQKIKHRRALF